MKLQLSLLTASLALAGCTTMQEIRQDTADTQTRIETRTQSLMDAQRSQMPGTGPIITDTPYVDVRAVQAARRLPPGFRKQVVVNAPAGESASVLAQRIGLMAGVPVAYQDELLTQGSSNAGLPALRAANALTIPVSYSGDVAGLLDAVASALGAAWRYDDASRSVLIYRYETATFRLPLVQGKGTTSASVGGASQTSMQGAGGLGGSQPMSTASATGSYSTEVSPWADVEATVKELMSAEGRYVLSETAGTLTVRDRPAKVAQVRSYITELTAALSRQVNVELTIYRVIAKDEDVRGLNWNALFQAAGNKYGIQINGLGQRPAMNGGTTATLTIPSSNAKWGGSQVILDALSTLGKTTVEQSTSLMTTNNQPAPFKAVRRTAYLASLAQGVSTVGGNAVSTGPTLTPGVVESGLNVYVIPHVMDDGKRVKLRVMASISTLESLSKIGTDTNFIQIPETSAREFQSEAWLTSGDTLVLAGFAEDQARSNTASPLDQHIWWMGGNSTASKSRELVVMTLRPIVTAVRSEI